MGLPLIETSVELSYFRGHFGIKWQAVDAQSVEAMSMFEDPVSTASLKLMFPAVMVT